MEFLRNHPDEAYTIGDLSSELSDTDVTLDDIDFALTNLAGEVIESKIVQERVYYMYRSDRP